MTNWWNEFPAEVKETLMAEGGGWGENCLPGYIGVDSYCCLLEKNLKSVIKVVRFFAVLDTLVEKLQVIKRQRLLIY